MFFCLTLLWTGSATQASKPYPFLRVILAEEVPISKGSFWQKKPKLPILKDTSFKIIYGEFEFQGQTANKKSGEIQIL